MSMREEITALGEAMVQIHHRIIERHGQGRGDWVPDTEIENAFIAVAIARLGPLRVLAEEAMARGEDPAVGRGMALVIDPLDGTTLYRGGDDGYTSTFAVEADGRLVAGFIYVPRLGQRYLAFREGGALMNGRPLAAPRAATETDVVALRLRDLPFAPAVQTALARHDFETEHLGSTARRLAEVASGQIAGMLKTVGAVRGVPRVWGIAGGLVACEAQGLDIWFDPNQHVILIGQDIVVSAVRAVPGFQFSKVRLDWLWSHLMYSDF